VRLGGTGDDRLPDFGVIAANAPALAQSVDVVVVSHFHLDHVGALPYLTEVLGYTGPVLMTHPTRAIAPIVLEDFLKMQLRGRREEPLYSHDQILSCFAHARCMQLQERVIIGELSVTPFYAGHVIGAVAILLECRGRSVLYTGDFTMVPDHHLSAARLPLALRPDVLITESTYATTIRSSKRLKEQELCRKIQETLEGGGKVLVPTFAIGRAQELCLLCEKHWARAKLGYPIYISRGMLDKALTMFRLFASWSSESVRKSENPFDFPHARTYDSPSVSESESPMVLFAGPSMLTGGFSLDIFTKWAPDSKNLVIIPGYCLPGTVGNEILAGAKQVEVGGRYIEVRCRIEYMSHSDHTDSRGIMQLIAQVAPKHVVLVHGSEAHMDIFQPIVKQRLRIPCSAPAVGEAVDLGTERLHEVWASPVVLHEASSSPRPPVRGEALGSEAGAATYASTFSGLLRKRGRESWDLHDLSPAGAMAVGLRAHTLRYRHEEAELEIASFRAAWSVLEPGLRHAGVLHAWTPARPPEAGPWPHGCVFLVSFLSVRCQLAVSSTLSGRAKAIIEWARSDECSFDAVAKFLDALGAG